MSETRTGDVFTPSSEASAAEPPEPFQSAEPPEPPEPAEPAEPAEPFDSAEPFEWPHAPEPAEPLDWTPAPEPVVSSQPTASPQPTAPFEPPPVTQPGTPLSPYGKPKPAWRPPRQTARTTILVALVLLASAGVTYGVTRWRTPGPEQAVQNFFAALEDGDAATALSHADLPAGADLSRYPLLTDQALADRGLRPSDVEVSGDAPAFTVTFTAAGSPVRQRIEVVEDDGEYRVQTPLVRLLTTAPVTVNGVALSAGETAAFPGAYRVVAPGNALFAESSATVVPLPGDGNVLVAQAAPGPRQLAAGAEEVIDEQVRARLDECAATTADRTPGCPFWLRVTGYTPYVRWSITDYPHLEIQAGSDGRVTFRGDRRGTAAWKFTYTDYYGNVAEKSGTVGYPVTGTARFSGSGIEVTVDES